MNTPLLRRGLALLLAGTGVTAAFYLGTGAPPARGEIIPNPAFDEFRQHLRTFHTLTVRIGEFNPAEPSMEDERYYPWGPTGGIRNLEGLPKGMRRHAGAPEEPWPADLPRVTWVPPQLAWLFQVPPINYPRVGAAPGSAIADLHAGGSMLITAREDTWVTVDPHEGRQRLRMGPGGATSCRNTPQTLQHFTFGDMYFPVLWSALRSGFDQDNPGSDAPESVGYLSPAGNMVWGSATLNAPGFEPGAVHIFFQFDGDHKPRSVMITTPEVAMFARIAVTFDPVVHDRYFEYPCPAVVPERFPPSPRGAHRGQGPEDAELCCAPGAPMCGGWMLDCDATGEPEPAEWPFPVVLPRAIGEFAPDSMPLSPPPSGSSPPTTAPVAPPTTPPQDPPPGGSAPPTTPPQNPPPGGSAPPTTPPQNPPPGGTPPPNPPPGGAPP